MEIFREVDIKRLLRVYGNYINRDGRWYNMMNDRDDRTPIRSWMARYFLKKYKDDLKRVKNKDGTYNYYYERL